MMRFNTDTNIFEGYTGVGDWGILGGARNAAGTTEIDVEKNLGEDVIRFITQHFRYQMPSPKDISKIGADVPACVLSVASRVGGIGEIVKPIDISEIDLWIVLVNPGIFVSTGGIFEDVIEKYNDPLEPFSHFGSTDQFIDYLKRQRNDLQDIATNKYPEIKRVLDTIEKTQDVLLTRMSGSGSTCFGLYKNQEIAKRAVSYIKKKNSEWWIKFSRVN